MSFFRSLALAVFLLPLHVYGFPDGQVQPGCFPPPVIPSNFTKRPDHWRSSSTWLAPRQSGKVWSGWRNVKYLFSLYGCTKKEERQKANNVVAAIPIQVQASTLADNNQIPAIHSETRHIPVLLPQMAPTISTSSVRHIMRATSRLIILDSGELPLIQIW